ncbi:TonB-dependent receptor domain-containing protein [Chitinophaga solisilvae]|uniref:TonB-dependent receptor domain-containing protein n=1 Tax=Chitinophaga solisilvae TaxID=1233460 RepID=UPI00136CB8CF|nr:TonB-dependent receptor [Chitinophaga solisilvae]
MNKFSKSKANWRLPVMCMLWLLVTGYARAQSPAMNAPVSLSLTNTTLAAVIAEIDRQSDLSFSYDRASLATVKINSAVWQHMPLKAVLAELSRNTGMQYEVSGNTVAVKSGRPQQPGSIRGRVVDFETSAPLPGATVQLQGTTAGAITDARGFYQLKDVAPGKYTLLVTFIGYQHGIVSNIVVESNRQETSDVKMQAGGALREVVVDAGPRKVRAVTHSTETQLIREVRNATGVVSGISNELIAKTPDRNAAEIVKRISGVTVVDDRFIVVRGMNERYNLTYLNGNIAPSTELYNKAFAYDLLPSSVIDKILVYKSPVADLVADYGGAAVKIFTKNAMPVKHFDIGIQLAHRVGSTLQQHVSYNGGKLDGLGFDDGTRKLPDFSPGIFHSNQKVPGTVSNATWVDGFSSTMNYGTRYSLPDMQLFANYYNSWKIGKARLYDLTAITFTKETTGYDLYRQKGNTNAREISEDTVSMQAAFDRNTRSYIRQSTETGKINILENLTLQWNDKHKLFLRNFFVNDGRRFTSVSSVYPNIIDKPGFYIHNRDIVLSFQQRTLYSGNLGGAHQLGTAGKHDLEWNLGFTHNQQQFPDQRIIHLYSSPNYGDTSWIIAATDQYGIFNRLYTKIQERIYNASLDYTFHVTPALSFKTGAYELFKLRQVGRRVFRGNRAGLGLYELRQPNDDPQWTTGHGINNLAILRFRQDNLSTFWSHRNFPDDNTGLAMYDGTSPVDAYVASEQYNAFYVMGDWKPADEKLVFNAGLRLEYDRQRLAGAKPGVLGNASLLPVNIDHQQTLLLPSMNISWRPGESLVLRGGYGRTVNRPDFREISPYNDMDFQNQEIIFGNKNIVPAIIDNYDLRAEWYPARNKSEMFNAGIFYKRLQHPIERMRKEVANSDYDDGLGYTVISYDNSVKAEIYGIEAEVKKSLSFIPGNLFRNLSFVFNGTLVKSVTERHAVAGNYFQDSIRVKGQPLQGQSPYVLNTGLFYENPAWGTKIGLIYNVSGPRIYAKSMRAETDSARDYQYTRADLLQLPVHLLDLSVTKRLIKSLQVKFSVQNLLDQAYRIVEDQNYNQHYDAETPVTKANGDVYYVGDNIVTKYKPGRYFLLQFTYSF